MTAAGDPIERETAARRSRWIPLLLGIILLDLLLLLPSHPDALTFGALALMPLELPPLLLLLIFAPGRIQGAICWTVAILLSCTTVLKALDFLTLLSYSRLFSPILDLHLVAAAWDLSRESFGLGLVLAATAAAIIGIGVTGWIAGWSARQVMNAGFEPAIRRQTVALASCLLVVFGVAGMAKRFEIAPLKVAPLTSRLVYDHARHVYHSIGDMQRFRAEARNDPFAAVTGNRLLARIRGHDVLMIFVESYGRSTVSDPRYAGTAVSALKELQRTIDRRGLRARSAWLTSPVIGGQSWLAHASVLSGLWINNQRRYGALLASKRGTLIDTFSSAGWDTVAVMPAITKGWPEGAALGYDRIYTANSLEYRGLPFNWVTMPDQFTLSQFHRKELAGGSRPPVFAEIAMISSHAPWTPIAPVLDWADVLDSRVFDKWAVSGDLPSKIWLDKNRVRDQYRKSIDYVLRTLNAFTADKLGADRLLVILGDHQPAPLISGPDVGQDVPVHIIGPPDLVAALDGWNWSEGVVPDRNAPVWSMKDFRGNFLRAFTPPEVNPTLKPSPKAPPLSTLSRIGPDYGIGLKHGE